MEDKDNKWSCTYECDGTYGKKGCKCETTLTQEDIFYVTVSVPRKYRPQCTKSENFYGFECPKCGAITELLLNNIPYNVTKDAKTRERDLGIMSRND